MNKRILSLIFAFAMVLGMIIPSAAYVHAATSTEWCEACKKSVTWTDVTGRISSPVNGGHYRLTQNVGAKTTTLSEAITICLDLAGYSYVGETRAFVLGDNTNKPAVVLNIMDSSAKKTGTLKGYGVSANYNSGVISAYPNTEINIYGGTIEALGNGEAMAKDGGAIGTYGNINMYDGKVIGNHVSNNGGAICLLTTACVFDMQGGTIISGKADGLGDCIYVRPKGSKAANKVTLSGNASPEQLYYAGDSEKGNWHNDWLTISGTYTGKTELVFASTPETDKVIGVCKNAEFAKENISISGSRLYGVASGSDLVATKLTGASVTDLFGSVSYYDTLDDAVADRTAGSVVKLLADNTEDITVSGNMTLDLSGWDMAGDITIDGTLDVKDSATDDHTVEDLEGYGVISSDVTGVMEAAGDYLMMTEDAGVSFHKYVLKLTKVNLRPRNAGIYYSSDILVDEVVLNKIDHYGIAVSTSSETPTADPADLNSLYTAFEKDDYGTADTSSVLINAVMDGENTDAVDAATMIYGRPYICFEDETYFYGNICATNLQQLTETIDKKAWEGLSLVQNRALMSMYDTYPEVMGQWDLANMQKSAQKATKAAKDRALKVLIIGNSHGLDSTNLLYEVFKEEGLPEEYDQLVLGAIYTGGCKVSEHANNAVNNLRYDYWMKYDGREEAAAWEKHEDPTMQEVLEDEDWDVVLLQEMNTCSAQEQYFQNDNIETVFTYVVNTLGYEPKFMWNMIWANPEIPESYVNYLYRNGDDSPGGDVGSGSEGDDNDTSDAVVMARKLAWIFQTQNPGEYEIWGKNYVKLWNNTRQVMYDNIVSNVQEYIDGNKVYNITADEVIPCATAIQYAIEWMGMHEQNMHRDYTHVSDLGRLVVAYLWYAKLTGKTSIDAPKYTLVSQTLENSRQALGYAKDYSIYSDVIKNSVNFALADHYGVIQNLTYAEYLALTADEQAAYKESFDSFSVKSGWTYEKWLEQAVVGVTYTDYVRMTAEQKTAYEALRDDFDTWYAGVVENLTYAEYFVMTQEEQDAYAQLRGDAFNAWLAQAEAAFAYSEYVMMTYEQQTAYQATFDEGAFDTHYANWLADMTYEEYMSLTTHQKLQYKKTYSSTIEFLDWYNAAKAAYEA